MKAMIFAAGLDTRLKPLTDSVPKALVIIKNKTLLEHAIQKLRTAGVTEIIVNVHHLSDQIITFLEQNDFGINISISDETDLLRDTGGGLKKVQHFFDDQAFILYNVDILTDINLKGVYQKHLQNNPLATLVVRKRETSRYLLFDDNYRLCGWENVKTKKQKIALDHTPLNQFAFSGIHIVSPEIFKLMPEKDVFSIIDLYLGIAGKYEIKAHVDQSDFWIDLGKYEQYKNLNN